MHDQEFGEAGGDLRGWRSVELQGLPCSGVSQQISDSVRGLQRCLVQSATEAASLFFFPHFTLTPLVTLPQKHTGKGILLSVVPV